MVTEKPDNRDPRTDTSGTEVISSYLGRVGSGGRGVSGTLDGFFLHGSEVWSGAISQKELTEQQCRFREIVLRSQVPDGSMLVLSRTEGDCQ
jgi:hypothetical protein